MKKFLDRLPRAISAKHEHAKRQGTHTYTITARLLDAILGQRVISMQYHSLESRREKLYTVHPSRLIHAQGGLYLIAFVPAYAEVRTFAVERIKKVTVQEVTFEPVAELEADPFKHSLGVHRGGSTCKVRLRFHPQIAPLVKERTWHASQQFNDRADGSVVMTLDVTDDYALRNWILGFGRFVKVLAPAQLVKAMEEELEAARQQYEVGRRGGRQRCSAAAAVCVAASCERVILRLARPVRSLRTGRRHIVRRRTVHRSDDRSSSGFHGQPDCQSARTGLAHPCGLMSERAGHARPPPAKLDFCAQCAQT